MFDDKTKLLQPNTAPTHENLKLLERAAINSGNPEILAALSAVRTDIAGQKAGAINAAPNKKTPVETASSRVKGAYSIIEAAFDASQDTGNMLVQSGVLHGEQKAQAEQDAANRVIGKGGDFEALARKKEEEGNAAGAAQGIETAEGTKIPTPAGAKEAIGIEAGQSTTQGVGGKMADGVIASPLGASQPNQEAIAIPVGQRSQPAMHVQDTPTLTGERIANGPLLKVVVGGRVGESTTAPDGMPLEIAGMTTGGATTSPTRTPGMELYRTLTGQNNGIIDLRKGAEAVAIGMIAKTIHEVAKEVGKERTAEEQREIARKEEERKSRERRAATLDEQADQVGAELRLATVGTAGAARRSELLAIEQSKRAEIQRLRGQAA